MFEFLMFADRPVITKKPKTLRMNFSAIITIHAVIYLPHPTFLYFVLIFPSYFHIHDKHVEAQDTYFNLKIYKAGLEICHFPLPSVSPPMALTNCSFINYNNVAAAEFEGLPHTLS
jgi:hypothetical protein